MVAGISRRLTDSSTILRAFPPEGGPDQQGHPDFRAVEAFAMVEKFMLPQSFAVIGREDHERSVQHAPSSSSSNSSPRRSSR